MRRLASVPGVGPDRDRNKRRVHPAPIGKSALRKASLLLAVALVAIPLPSLGAGFSIFEQGSKAMGTAGAFTGQADDPSAMFHNVGGLAFFQEREIYGGLTLISPLESTFEGEAPFPGVGVLGAVEDTLFTPIHVYWAEPLNDRWTFGASVNNPFGLSVDWDDDDGFAGRFISSLSELVSFDISANVGYRVNESLGVGFGVIGRAAEIKLERRAGAVNPFNQSFTDVADVRLESDFDFGVGFQVGFLHKIGSQLSWGASYRSTVEVDFSGEGAFTQIASGFPQFDAAVAAQLPFGVVSPLSTTIEFPDAASLGVSIGLTRRTRLNADINWTGWSSFDVVALDFDNDALDSDLVQDYDDAMHYRVGLTFTTHNDREWRVGFVYDETPQPSETTGPVLPDANRNGFTLGYGTSRFDVALMYLLFEERTTLNNRDSFFGTYNTEVALLGVSFKL